MSHVRSCQYKSGPPPTTLDLWVHALSSSYGLSGWILAKEALVEQQVVERVKGVSAGFTTGNPLVIVGPLPPFISRYGRTKRLTCPTNHDGKLPDGQISSSADCPLSSPLRKNISLNPSGKSPLEIRPSHPRRGGSRVVTNARWDAMDSTASGGQRDPRAGLPCTGRALGG